MRNYLKDQLGFDVYQPLDLKENKYLTIGIKGRTYQNKYSIYIVKFDSNIYKNIYPNILYESHEISLSKKEDTRIVFDYLYKNYNKLK